MIRQLEKGYINERGRQGKWQYFLNGKLVREIEYVDDKKDGTVMLYYHNGILGIKALFTAGILNGIWEEYYETGTLKETGLYRYGKYEPVSFYKEDGRCLMMNGTGKRIEILGEEKKHIYEQYYKNGTFLRERCIGQDE